MTTPSFTRIAMFALLIGTCMSSAHAASTWTFTGTSTAIKATQSGSDPNLTSFSGVYAANGAGNSGFANNATWNSKSLSYFSGNGLGMYSGGDSSSPYHAFDNNENTEALLLNFSSSVVLTSIGLGYINTDSDISLFRYTGASAPTLAGTGASLTSMNSAGWELVSNYSDLSKDTSNPYNLVNSGNAGSSWWLISAYNKSYGDDWSQGNDFFKLYAVAASKCTSTVPGVCGPKTTPGTSVPEPASLALISIGLLGMAGVRRRRNAKRN